MKTPLVILALAASTAVLSANPTLVKLWETEATLKVPESVLHDVKRDVLYVTNIDGEPWGDDGKGSVGKVSLEGKVIKTDWVTGLSAPKGMALHHNRLYIGDVGNIVVVDVDRGEIVDRIKVEGSNGLNDVAVDAQGVLYVSDSRAKKLYRIEQGRATLLLEGLKGPNGVHVRGSEVFFMDNGSLYRLGKDNAKVLISAGMEGNGDGLESDDRGGFVISYWPGVIQYAKADGSRVPLLDTSAEKIYAADIGYHATKRIVYVPTFFGNTVVAYELK